MAEPVYGFADTHAHFTAEYECGGSLFWGYGFSESSGGDDARLEDALGPRQAGFTIGELQEGTEGYPTFDQWPRFNTFYYQQAYIDWIRRSYQHGLRIVACLCVNSESFTQRLYGKKKHSPTLLERITREVFAPLYPFDNKSVINIQVSAIKQMAQYVADHQGGWMEIAYSPEQAREIIGKGRLAVVLGIEVDSLGNWRKPQDLENEAQQRNTDVRTVIRCELERMHRLGIRQITPIHLIDNPFGGASVYKVIANTANVDMTGQNFDVGDGFGIGVRYRMDLDDGSPAPRLLLEALGLLESESDSILSPYYNELIKLNSHRNRLGLTEYGEMLVEEMMRLGMLIDLDHMSEASKERTLEIAWTNHYPLIHSHALGFRDLALTADVPYAGDARRTEYRTSKVYNVANEFHATRRDLERVRDLGGMVSVLLNQGEVRDFDGPNGVKNTARATVENNSSGSSRSWAQAYLYSLEVMGGQNVGLGSDVNGFAGLPGPRFGTHAAYELEDDPFRDPDGALRVNQAEAQVNGVRYAEPIHYTGAARFDGTAYDGDGDAALNRDIWRAIAMFKAQGEPEGQDRAENIAIGLLAGASGDERRLKCGVFGWECSHQRRAGFLVTSGRAPNDSESQAVREMCAKIQQYFRRWQALEGDNPPLTRCYVGQRDYDYNLDGFAHYGMMPDFLQDLRNIGLKDEHLHSLNHSAEAYVQTWERCGTRSEAIFGDHTLPSAGCGTEE